MRRPVFVLSVCIMLCVAVFRWRSVDKPEPPDKSRILVCGKVIDKKDDSFVLRLRKTSSHLPSDKIFQSNVAVLRQENPELISYNGSYGKLECKYENAAALLLGSELILEGEFRGYSAAGNPGEFDYAAYYHALDYGGRIERLRILSLDAGRPGIREYLYRVRAYWQQRLYHIFPDKEASIMTAMLLGDKSDLDEDIKTLYRKNGIIHILSISGLHITLIGVGFYKRIRRLGVPAWIAALAGGGLLFLYGRLTGFGISACRAIGMYLIRMLSYIVGRTYDMLTALGVVGVLLVCAHPAWLTHMGFLLSYTSVLGVGALLPAFQKWIGDLRMEIRRPRMSGQSEIAGGCAGAGNTRIKLYMQERWKSKLFEILIALADLLKQGFLAGISVTLTTLPVQLWFSYEIPVYSIFLNVLILPFMSVVMVAGLAAMVVPGFGIVGTLDVFILWGYESLCRLFEKLPYPMWNPGRPGLWQVICYYIIWSFMIWGIPCLHKYARKRDRKQGHSKRHVKLNMGMLSAILAVCVISLPRLPENRMTFLDVGQGDGMCLQLASGEVYLFDCGSTSRTKIGERVLIPFLKYYGISEVEAVFISHGDADHLNGLSELLAQSREEHIRIRQVILPDLEEHTLRKEFDALWQIIDEMDDPPVISTVSTGMSWESAGGKPVAFLCLHPDKHKESGNAASECFYISFPAGNGKGDAQVHMLLTGDVEGAGERELLAALQKYQITNIDILKCPHHGSKGTTGAELLEQLKPTVTVISCGQNNRYGHPHAELLERLRAVDSRIFQTQYSGAVTVRMGKKGYRIVTYK